MIKRSLTTLHGYASRLRFTATLHGYASRLRFTATLHGYAFHGYASRLRFTATLSCILLLLVGNASLLSAQEENSNDDNMLGVVVVTDTGKKAKVLNTNASMTVLTAKDIKRSGHRTVLDLLGSIPGVTDISSGWGQVWRLSVRGTTPTVNWKSAGPAVYVDGVPLNTGNGVSYFNMIPVETIEKIEVLKSPSSALYGQNAARGVILITTKNGSKMKKSLGASTSLEYGSWKTYGGSATVRGNLGIMDYSLSGT